MPSEEGKKKTLITSCAVSLEQRDRLSFHITQTNNLRIEKKKKKKKTQLKGRRGELDKKGKGKSPPILLEKRRSLFNLFSITDPAKRRDRGSCRLEGEKGEKRKFKKRGNKDPALNPLEGGEA